MIAIAGIGLCTAQGSAAEILAGGPLSTPAPLPWDPSQRTTCPIAFAARGIDRSLRGLARWRALADAALAELGGRRDVPLLIGSCNGAAGDDASWARAFAELGDQPIASAACASGLHALWLGATWLAAGHDEVIVLAVDVLSRPSHDHFEALRVLASDPAPWQSTATGFIPGEAAVALRLRRVTDAATPISGRVDVEARQPIITGPALAHDHEGFDALGELARVVVRAERAFVIGQGTGPAAIDDRELAAIRAAVSPQVPLTTALTHFGHTVGASGLLSVALAALTQQAALPTLAMPHATASDGRVLGAAHGTALVTCRALGGACAAVGVGVDPNGHLAARGVTGAVASIDSSAWSAPASPPALRMPLLRRLAEEALAHRPAIPPGALLVRLAEPLVPPDDARIGTRILPSVVLEMTPGFLAQLVARAWGYGGPALCFVGGSDTAWERTLVTCRLVHGEVAVLTVNGRDFEWRV
jgi:hypothetical protein